MHDNFIKKNEEVLQKLHSKVQEFEKPYTAEDIDAMGHWSRLFKFLEYLLSNQLFLRF